MTRSMVEARPLLQVRDLGIEFDTRRGAARVIDGLNFSLGAGETLGIVGESGCGKSVTALAVMGLVPSPPGRVSAGWIRFDGEDLLTMEEERLRQIRGNDIAMVFQEPMTSLNPVYTIGEQIAEVIRLHRGSDRKRAIDQATDMLRQVDIAAPKKRVAEYPYQLSGGMRQRVMIAMALACSPRILIADEPTTALDVTVQAGIFDLLKSLQERTGASILFITHDMGSIAQMADRVMVMYAGRKVEEGPVENILSRPRHPYTIGLIACVPHLEAEPSEERPPLMEIPGMVPSLTERACGCPFAPRCSHVMARCRTAMPPEFNAGPAHTAACWLEESESADDR